ncbi:aspartate aminotransferase family protein [Streptomyces sp. KMM 9044]|uniref:aspartate aminotransferase family protein n=1 Tax=Streptomyces sp. KMM 9044 TaxID=2744474 RepID=UPI002150F19C|nr:aspartate aminotransferase family protein [Streptomyces sp. KMM 9044]WAX78118.1 aspartate aminotransferase family protein [Streptomyces sp. KMM 9044]
MSSDAFESSAESPTDAHRRRERELLGPGISAAVDWIGIVVARAEGARVWDTEGKSYLDFMGGAGVNLIGHSHPRLVSAIAQQSRAWMIGAHASKARLALLEKLSAVLPDDTMQTQFYSGGSEAVEAALRLAKSATGRFGVLSFWNSFHGRTAAGLALTPGAHGGYGPAVPGVTHAPYADCASCPLRLTFPSCGFACVDHARQVVAQSSAPAPAAIVVEPVQGRAGNLVPPSGYLAALRELARELGALLVVDESMTGFGRTGRMFAVEHDDVVPDVLIMGKGMGGGYPVTAVAAHRDLMRTAPFGLPSGSSSSFGGFPLACAAASAVLDVVRDEHLVTRGRETGNALLRLLTSELGNLPVVGRIQGQGMALGIQLVDPRCPRTAFPRPRLRRVVSQLAHHGVLVMAGGNSLRLYPPLNVGLEDAEHAVAVLGGVLADSGPAT